MSLTNHFINGSAVGASTMANRRALKRRAGACDAFCTNLIRPHPPQPLPPQLLYYASDLSVPLTAINTSYILYSDVNMTNAVGTILVTSFREDNVSLYYGTSVIGTNTGYALFTFTSNAITDSHISGIGSASGSFTPYLKGIVLQSLHPTQTPGIYVNILTIVAV